MDAKSHRGNYRKIGLGTFYNISTTTHPFDLCLCTNLTNFMFSQAVLTLGLYWSS